MATTKKSKTKKTAAKSATKKTVKKTVKKAKAPAKKATKKAADKPAKVKTAAKATESKPTRDEQALAAALKVLEQKYAQRQTPTSPIAFEAKDVRSFKAAIDFKNKIYPALKAFGLKVNKVEWDGATGTCFVGLCDK